jgi:hypothetical protein
MDSDILQLYRQPGRVKELVRTRERATAVVLELGCAPGWRERCSAAVVVEAFRLGEQIPGLVETFKANPEIRTCRCFARMISQTLGRAGCEYLVAMREACAADARGMVLVRNLDDAIRQLEKA